MKLHFNKSQPPGFQVLLSEHPDTERTLRRCMGRETFARLWPQIEACKHASYLVVLSRHRDEGPDHALVGLPDISEVLRLLEDLIEAGATEIQLSLPQMSPEDGDGEKIQQYLRERLLIHGDVGGSA